jgi:hypothetical protein
VAAFSLLVSRLPLQIDFSPTRSHIPGQMCDPPSEPFICPNCAAKYEIVRIEAPPRPQTDREITCLSCGGPLHGREGKFLLKYFLTERPKRRAYDVVVTQSSQKGRNL